MTATGRGESGMGPGVRKTVSHAEGQAAVRMGEKKMPWAWLDINNNYICPDCWTWIRKVIPQDSVLVVRYHNGQRVVSVTFVGESPIWGPF